MQIVDSGAGLLPRRGPEALEYIPLGRKRSHPSDNGEKVQLKKAKRTGNSLSDSTDGFTYMGEMEVCTCCY